MQNERLISTQDFCTFYQVENSFIHTLQQQGLIEIINVDDKAFIDHDHLQSVEKLIRLHYDLEINVEGIEAIVYLLQRVDEMQNEISILRNKLHLYNEDSDK